MACQEPPLKYTTFPEMGAYEAALRAQLVSLEARLATAKGYFASDAMFVESKLLFGQILAIKDELEGNQS